MPAVDIAQPGKYIIVRNAKIDMFHGSMRLAVNHWGKVEPATEDLSFEPNVRHQSFAIQLLESLVNPGMQARTEYLNTKLGGADLLTNLVMYREGDPMQIFTQPSVWSVQLAMFVACNGCPVVAVCILVSLQFSLQVGN